MIPLIKMENISKTYTIGPNKLNILKSINIKINKGELIGIIGQSGSGKSTLMNIIGLLDKPTNGNYLMEGVPVDYSDDNRLSELINRKIGFIFQQYNLISTLTAVENVKLPLLYRRESPSISFKKAIIIQNFKWPPHLCFIMMVICWLPNAVQTSWSCKVGWLSGA